MGNRQPPEITVNYRAERPSLNGNFTTLAV